MVSILNVIVIALACLPPSYLSAKDLLCIQWEKTRGTKTFVDKLYTKYSSVKTLSGTGQAPRVLSSDDFNKMLTSLGIGSVVVKCQPNDDECNADKLAFHSLTGKEIEKEEEDDDDHHRRRRRREVDVDHHDEEEEEREMLRKHQEHWQKHLQDCFKSDALLKLNAVNVSDGLTQQEFISMCPSLLQQIDTGMCVHKHVKMEHHTHVPSAAETWGYGFVSITLISLLSLSVIAVIPCLKKSYYVMVMAYLVALAVGTLAGDALLHLIPHAFVEGANSATNSQMSESNLLKQHYSQVYRALMVLLGIYVFFVVEQMMKMKALYSKKSKHDGEEGQTTPIMPKKEIRRSDDDVKFEMAPPLEHSLSCTSDVHNDHNHDVSEEGGHYHADDRHHHHHHGEKEITKETKIASVAWMVIVGDGFHNFSDGLAVGAAFSASLSSGISTAIAVFCHELPHELGDFAILIKSGMTVRQAIVYNLVSAVLAYFGLVIGIFAGASELGRHFILSITAGMFLYVSLADMLPELTHQDIPASSRCATFICQHLGVLTGIGIMLVISLYEHDM